MNLEQLLRLLTILQIIKFSQNSHVQQAKQRIRADVRSVIGRTGGNWPSPQLRQHQQHHHHNQQRRQHHWHAGQRVHRWPSHQQRWSGGRGRSLKQHHHYTAWTAWSRCGSDCIKRRERYCKVKRKCGHTKQLEEQKCWSCDAASVWHDATSAHKDAAQTTHHHSSNSPAIIINAPHTGLQPLWTTQPPPMLASHVRLPVLQEIESDHPRYGNPSEEHHHAATDDNVSDFYIIKSKPKYKKRRKPIYIDVDDYSDLEAEEEEDEEWNELQDQKSYVGPVQSIRMRNQRRLKGRRQKQQQQRTPPNRHPYDRVTQRNLASDDDGIEGDTFQYEDFDFEHDAAARATNAANEEQYNDSYEDADYGDYRNGSLVKERATPDALIPRHRRIYSKWSRWTKCSPKCTTRRYKKCRIREQCGREVLREIAYCYTEGSFCQQWLAAQVQKTPPYELRPGSNRRRDISAADGPQSNAITNDYIMNGKGYRGPEYAPMKLKCGIAPIRSNKRNMYNMLKIIGGKAARKGEWPWQVAIFNRFKEAFCGGTLIAPEWVITAAHCVRKVLYVRLGEHNLDYEDGTELQLRVLRSYKHPNFDKKTVDSDVALLKLPRAANITTWIGYSCLPRPYQPLPKNMDCTVIGWGKRRNRDIAGTSVLHQAEVPIIPMDNCRSVYHDYTITKNMFCAGHRRGRIDTCAGDSGGPLLCRDTTKPNHPWTIFGITSFGDGCAKRNKFGIYAKVPNYVDWVWSVINCNGNCKLHQRSYGN